MDIILLYRILYKKRKVLVIIPLIIVAITFLITLNMPSKYKSTAQLATGYTTQDKIQVTEERLDLREASVKFSNLVETINSELIMNMVSYKLILHDWQSPDPFREIEKINEEFSINSMDRNRYIGILRKKYDQMEVLTPYNQTEYKIMEILKASGYLSSQIKENIKVSRVRDTDFVTIEYISNNPFLAAFVVNTAAEEFIRYDNSTNKNFSGKSVDFFARQVEQKQEQLDNKTEEYNNFLKRSGFSNYNFESEAIIDQINEYELRKQDAEAEVQRLTLLLEDVNNRLSKTTNKLEKSEINARIINIKNRIAQLNNLNRTSNSSDTTLEKAIRDLRYQLQLEINKLNRIEDVDNNESITDGDQLKTKKEELEINLKIAKENLMSINNKLASLKSNIRGYASKEAALQKLRAAVDKATEDLKEAQERYDRELNKAMVSETSVRIVQKGKPSLEPESSNRILILGMAGLASFFFCAFIVVLVEYLDPRLKYPEQFKRITDLKLAGSIPLVTIKGIELKNLFNQSMPQPGEGETLNHFLRKLRYVIENDPSKIYLITSNKRKEGKSFFILCLALTLSLLKKKILIIDTNFKNNDLTKALLSISNEENLPVKHKFLLPIDGKEDAQTEDTISNDEDYVQSIITATKNKQIFLIGNIGELASPSEIFAERDFDRMIDYLKLKYDYILMEGPALNEFSDTQELIEYTEKVIPVFSAESEIKQIDRESLDYLKKLNGKLMGAVLNKVKRENWKM